MTISGLHIKIGRLNTVIILSVCSGLGGFLAFPPIDISLFAWVSLVPLFFALRKTTGYREAFFCSYLAGAVFFAASLYWLAGVSVPGYMAVIVIMAFFHALFGLFARMVIKYSMSLLSLPFAWVIAEYSRGHVFGGFPWVLLAHSQYRNINLIQLADITGAYGVSFVVAAFSTAVYAWASGHKKKVSFFMLSLFLMIASTSYGIYRTGEADRGETAIISVIQGNISQDIKWLDDAAEDIARKYSQLSLKAAEGKPDLIVWPETSYPYLLADWDDSVSNMEEIFSDTGVPVLAGAVYETDGKYYNGAVLFDGSSPRKVYRKIHLVPFGEYVPFEEYFENLRQHIDKPIGNFAPGKDYVLFPFKSLRKTEDPDGSITRRTVFHKAGVMICFEDVFPYIARNFALSGAGILINITNDAWFGDTAASRQHLQSSVFRAVENRTPVVRAANTGISCFIDRNGKVFSQVRAGKREIFIEGYDSAEIHSASVRSLYTVYGDIFVVFAGIFLAVIIFVEYLSHRSQIKTA